VPPPLGQLLSRPAVSLPASLPPLPASQVLLLPPVLVVLRLLLFPLWLPLLPLLLRLLLFRLLLVTVLQLPPLCRSFC
jgi:hypothetical protein